MMPRSLIKLRAEDDQAESLLVEIEERIRISNIALMGLEDTPTLKVIKLKFVSRKHKRKANAVHPIIKLRKNEPEILFKVSSRLCNGCSNEEIDYTIGISYVVPCIMAQENSNNLRKLSPLVIRPPVVPACNDHKYHELYHRMHNEPTACVSLLADAGEACIKRYLLHGVKDADVFSMRGLAGAYALFNSNNTFSCLHYKLIISADSSWSIVPVGDVKESDVQIGFLVRKGKGGTGEKASLRLLKQLGVGHAEEFESFTRMSLCVRIELYVNRGRWKILNNRVQSELMRFAMVIESHTEDLFRGWNQHAFSNLVSGNHANREPQVHGILRHMVDSIEREESAEAHIIRNIIDDMLDQICIATFHSQKFPLYLIGTRDSFSYPLVGIAVESRYTQGSDTDELLCIVKDRAKKTSIDWYLNPGILPAGFDTKKYPLDVSTGMFPIGVRTFINVYTDHDIARIESHVDDLYKESLNPHSYLQPETYAHSGRTAGLISRTKMFFNARYLWTRSHFEDPDAAVAGGIRRDVSKAPSWMSKEFESKMIEAGVISQRFVNSFACNIYHDGSEGLAQHYDDIGRFKHPVISLRLYSDSRLSFGCKLYGFNNGLFTVPMPRGSITILQENGFASNEVKHCIRPQDMSGKSGVLIMRQIHQHLMEQAYELQLTDLIEYFQVMDLDLDDWQNKLTRRASRDTTEITSLLNTLIKKVERLVGRKKKEVNNVLSVEHQVQNVLRDVIKDVKKIDQDRKADLKIHKQCSQTVCRLINTVELKAMRPSQFQVHVIIRNECAQILNDIIRQICLKEPNKPVKRKKPRKPRGPSCYNLFISEFRKVNADRGWDRNSMMANGAQCWATLDANQKGKFLDLSQAMKKQLRMVQKLGADSGYCTSTN